MIARSVLEAAFFTLGCLVLDRRRLDPEPLGEMLVALAAALALALLIATAPGLLLNTVGIDPDEVHTILD